MLRGASSVPGGGGGGSTDFDDLTSGTNTSASMVVGSGASIDVSGTGTVKATSVVAVDAAGDTTTFPLLAGAATGSTNPLTDAGLTYNATTNALTATTFVGALSGNATTATASTNVTVANEATDTTCFPLFVTGATGDLSPKSNSGLAFNSNSGLLTATALASGVTTLTTTSASALSVGANGATNPSLLIDNSTASAASGLQITGRATGTGPLVAAIGSGANQPLTITTKGTGQLNLQTAGTGDVLLRPGGATTATFDSALTTITTEVDITGSSTTVAATPTIDAAALLGQDIITWTPSAATAGTAVYVTNRMRKTIVDTTNGSITTPAHPIAGYDYLEMTGANTLDLAFVHEAKFKKSGAGTLNNVSFYKPAIDTIAGSVSNIVLYDGDMDLTGVTYTNAYLMNNANRSYLAFNTVGTITGATGNQVPTSVWPSIATGRFYFSRGWGSTSTAAITKDLCIAGPPIVIPERTSFTGIGINTTVGVASSLARLGLYKMGANGLPTALVLDAGTVSTATTGDKFISTSFTLEAGAYFPVYQSTGGATGATVSTLAFTGGYLTEIYGLGSADPASTAHDWIYFANTGAFPSTFSAATRLLVGAVAAVYIKK